jgi:hypothetical protein
VDVKTQRNITRRNNSKRIKEKRIILKILEYYLNIIKGVFFYSFYLAFIYKL